MTIKNEFFDIKNLKKSYTSHIGFFQSTGKTISVLRNLSLKIYESECLGLVGESGSGKTTFGRCLIRLNEPDAGQIIFRKKDILKISIKKYRSYRPKFQMIFQNHRQSLNPLQSVQNCLEEPLKVLNNYSPKELSAQVNSLLFSVDLSAEILRRLPHELSGGQRQRLVIARALASTPIFLIADEPTSSLDYSLKQQIINVLKNLKKQYNLTLLLISHDLTMIAKTADRIAVMFKGNLIEIAPVEELISNPMHPYTKQLIQISNPTTSLKKFEGTIQTINEKGCSFKNRCVDANGQCAIEAPMLKNISKTHVVACHLFMKQENKLAAKNIVSTT